MTSKPSRITFFLDEQAHAKAYATTNNCTEMPTAAIELVTEQILLSVTSSESIGHAQQLMFDTGFKQLPVVDEYGIPVGLLTSSRLIQQIRQLDPTLRAAFELRPINDAYLEDPIIASHKRDIFNLLDSVKKPSAILLVDELNKLIKIITSRDIAVFFRNRAEDLLLLELLKDNLKARIISIFGNETPSSQAAISQLPGSL